jgi:hypothetical protein
MMPFRTIAVVVLLWTIWVGLWSPRCTQAQVAVADLTPLNSSSVTVTYSTAITNRQTSQTTMTATVKNISSKAVTGPVYFAIDAITPSSVTVVNALLTSVEGIPLFMVEAASWTAGASRAISMVFANPTRVRFDIQQRVLIKAAKATPPQVTITSPTPLSVVNLTSIPVTGTVSATATSVTVNGVSATLQNQTWAATVPLQEGSNTLTAVARDAAGNTGTASVQVTRDTTLPTLTATATPLPNAAGWNNTDVTVTFAATDNLSGIATVTAPVTVTAESADHVVSGTATDRAGNRSTLDVHVRLDKTPPGINLTSPANGTTLKTTVVTVTGTVSDALSGVASVSCNGTAAAVSNATFTCTVSLSEGANTIQVQAADSAGNGATASLAVMVDTISPHVTIETPANNSVLFDPQVRVAGTVDDQTAHVSINGQVAPVSNGQWEVTLPLALGATTITVIAMDGAGNTGQQSVQVTRKALVVESITLGPVAFRLTAVGAQQPLTVTGHFSNSTTQDLTTASSGTTYDSSNPSVASVSADGVVTAVANGTPTITAHQHTFSATASVTVEMGVTLAALDLAPATTTLRTTGATQPLHLTGTFADGSRRDLTAAATGTGYTSSDPGVATVSADGVVTAVTNGTVTVTATGEQLSATAQVTVALSGGPGFLRGAAYDDTLGLPLASATVTLLADGSGPLTPPHVVVTDARGQFLLLGMAGEAVVRIDKAGFTGVERQGTLPPHTALTLLNARLTPVDTQPNLLTSALGGQAHDLMNSISLDFPPASLVADTDIRVTALSNQGFTRTPPPGVVAHCGGGRAARRDAVRPAGAVAHAERA